MRKYLYAVLGGSVLILWIAFGKTLFDNLVSSGTIDPTIAFIIFWAGIAIAARIGIQVLGGVLTKPHVLTKTTGASLSVLLGFDLLYPPWMVLSSGALVTSIVDGWYKIDWQLGRVLGFVVPSDLLQILVYGVFGILLLVVIPVVLLPRKKLIKLLSSP